MHIIRLLIVGLIVGVLARFFYPGAVHLNLLMSALLGIAGAFVAGLIGKAVHPSSAEPVHPAGFIYSILGAMALIFIGRLLHLV